MINTKSGVFVTITNNDDYALTMQKTKCDNPVGMYHIEINREFKTGEERKEHFFMTKAELNYFARALII